MSVKKKVNRNAFKNWINEVGINKLAAKLKIKDSAVRHWRRGHALPMSSQMYRITKMSKGKVTYSDMIDRFFILATKKK